MGTNALKKLTIIAAAAFWTSIVFIGCNSPAEPEFKSYTIAFDANGGTVSPLIDTTGADNTLESLPVPIRVGYTFNGWYTAADGGDIVTTSTKFNKNTTVYARWTETYGSFTDSRDGQTYRTVKIGLQTWMAENLNYAIDSSWCYDNEILNCNIYGRLYTWASAMGIGWIHLFTLWNGSDENRQGVCPNGWRLPNDRDWDTLMVTIGSGVYEVQEQYINWNSAGTKLKTTTGWRENWNGTPAGTDEFGFSALPAGLRTQEDYFLFGNGGDVPNTSGYWWSATETNERNAQRRFVSFDDAGVFSGSGTKEWSHSVRCIKN